MKRLIRSFLIEAGVLYIVSTITSGLTFSDGLTGILITAVALTLASLIIRPVINILLLPINLITFGLFRWLANVVVLYLVDLVIPQFAVGIFHFGGYANEYFSLPALTAPNVFVSYIIFSLILSLVTSLLYWLVK